MPRIQPLLPFLKPLGFPRAAPCRHFFPFSTATRLRVEQLSNPESSIPDPKEASHAADLAATEAATDADSAQSPAPKSILPSKRPNSKSRPTEPADAFNVSKPPEPSCSTDTTPDLQSNAKNVKTLSKTKRVNKKAWEEKRPQLQLPPPRYHISRSANKNLPIYTDYKRGGNLHLTTVRKITGDISALRDELRVFLNKKNEEVKINSLTGHVIVKGHHVPEITEFLKARGM